VRGGGLVPGGTGPGEKLVHWNKVVGDLRAQKAWWRGISGPDENNHRFAGVWLS